MEEGNSGVTPAASLRPSAEWNPFIRETSRMNGARLAALVGIPILPNPEDPDCGNLYQNLKFREAVYEHIEQY
jgi:hypothetical protein